MAIPIATLEARLVADTSRFDKGMRTAETGMQKTSRSIQKGALLAGGAIAGGLGVAAKIGWDEFAQGQKVAAQTNAVLESTGGIANVSAKQVADLGLSLMKKSGVDDEVIKSGANLLLTFRGIRNETGKGNDVFNQATKATLDLSVAMGKDMSSSAILVGKALNDPIRGMSALRRVGVQFTVGQEATIKKLVETGHTMQAQKIILKELNTEFGGSAEAAGKTLPGQLNILRETFRNFAGTIVGKVIPVLLQVIGFFRRHATLAKLAAGAVAVFTAALIAGGAALFLYESALGKGIVKLFRYLFTTRTVTGATRAMTAAQWLLNVALDANPIGIVIVALAALGVGLVIAWKKSETFRRVVTGAWDKIKSVTITVFKKVREFVTGTFQAVKDAFLKYTPLGIVIAHWRRIRDTTVTVWNTVKDKIVQVVTGIRDWVKERLNDIVGFYSTLGKRIAGAVGGGWHFVTDKIHTVVTAIRDWVKGRVDGIVDVFTAMPGRIGAAISAGADKLREAVYGLLRKALPSWAEDALGISSPSKVFERIGGHIVDGLIEGMAGKAGDLKQAALKTAGSLLALSPGSEIYAGTGTGLNVGGGTWQQLAAWANQNGWAVTSTTGGVHAPGSLHYQGKAIDVDAGEVADNMRAFYSFLGVFGGRINELFFDPAGFYIDNGARVSGAIGGHSDHVHVGLFDQGGWLKSGMAALNLSGRTERVLSPPETAAYARGGGRGGDTIIHVHGAVIDGGKLLRLVDRAELRHGRRNGGGG